MSKGKKLRRVPALRVHQWLKAWDRVEFDAKHHRAKPQPYFYLFSLPATELRSLCGIFRRQTMGVRARAADLGIQRRHDPERSEEIGRFVEYGFPWSTLSEKKRASPEFNDLRKPGWLPTAIVVNILESNAKRLGKAVAQDDVVTVVENESIFELLLPYEAWSKDWHPASIPPLEVIDGQHRLWAFEGDGAAATFEVPVVAFHGLDISWQAYLFWTINIKPKRINASLAFDLYPLLRSEDWLDKAEGHSVYRETRCQELTEALWSQKESPWYDRINMLGEPGIRWVSQAAWIRSLMATFVRAWAGPTRLVGGLFGGRLSDDNEVLGWTRIQQAAFLIHAWRLLSNEISGSNNKWAKELRAGSVATRQANSEDAAFYGHHSLIATDQGVRGFLHVLNDICFLMAARLKLRSWTYASAAPEASSASITSALSSAEGQPFSKLVRDIAKGLTSFDWRTSAAPGISEDIRRQKLVFRGSSGYRELRAQLLEHLGEHGGEAASPAKRLRAATA